ncbi:MAG: anthranilate synthase component II [Pseudoramibacter sp.]
MILLIDNYDSFSYNLYQVVGSLNPDIQVIRNDEKTVSEIEAMAPDAIILSPGPGRPKDAGVIEDVVKQLGGQIPILGICLGHQAIGEARGAAVTYAKKLMHGKASDVTLDKNSPLFANCPKVISAGRYHSLAIDRSTLPADLKVIAETKDREVMAIGDDDKKVYGIQFHPESILTPQGKQILKNFLAIAEV